jgi:histidine phosphotransferase ChpT
MRDAEDLTIAEAMCSHLCHELISPVTAVNNGLELMRDGNAGVGPGGDALDLVRHSAVEASRRLQFYRLAYGLATGFDGDPGFATVRSLAEGLLARSKVRLEWGEGMNDPSARPGRGCAKLALNMIALGRDALPRGGVLTVRLAGEGARGALSVAASGPGAVLKDDLRAALAAEPGAIGPRTVQAYLASRLARDLGSALALDLSMKDRVLITAMVDPAR